MLRRDAARFKLISCEVLFREMCHAAAHSLHQADVEFLPKGLHDLGGAPMRARLQQSIDRVDAQSYDAVLMGYALCGNGSAGLVARTLPLVIPRAHDCIALLMGSRQKYQEYFERNPGVYYRSTGWLERGEDIDQSKVGPGSTLEEFIARYGEDNGTYLYQEFTAYQRNYRQLTYISTGVEPDGSFEQRARDEAARRGWQFDYVAGSLAMFERLLAGNWDESEFLVVPPGWRVTATYDGSIMDKEPAV